MPCLTAANCHLVFAVTEWQGNLTIMLKKSYDMGVRNALFIPNSFGISALVTGAPFTRDLGSEFMGLTGPPVNRLTISQNILTRKKWLY